MVAIEAILEALATWTLTVVADINWIYDEIPALVANLN